MAGTLMLRYQSCWNKIKMAMEFARDASERQSDNRDAIASRP